MLNPSFLLERVFLPFTRSWHARIERDYRDHRLRLAHALRVERERDALAEGRSLLALLARQDGPYTAWLRSITVQLQAKASERESK